MKRVLELQSIRAKEGDVEDQAWSTASLARCGTQGASTYSLVDCGNGPPKV
jgi:hypothetical protein